MVIESGVDYNVVLTKYYIENGHLIDSNSEKWHRSKHRLDFQPNTEKPIFLDFISINTNDQNSILVFCNKYGLTGFSKAYRNESLAIDQLIEYDTIPVLKESLKGFINEVVKFRSVIHLNEFLKLYYTEDKYSDKYEEMYHAAINSMATLCKFEDDKNLSKLCIRLKYDHEIDMKTIDPITLPDFMYEFILKQVNSCLLNIFPQLNLGIEGNYKKKFLGYWKAPTLLNAMYYELFLKMSDGKIIRNCKNSTCNNHFEIIGNDTRKIYCCHECANLEAKRKERARKKIKSIKDGD